MGDQLMTDQQKLEKALDLLSRGDYFHDFTEGDDEELELAKVCRDALAARPEEPR